ncbi:MAG: DeoR/GlpR family DNA-binding transcription regulator [Eubacteriales bacterium]|nr:DeoR/GlpR family DNA-binding transcription regulator [Eubacteriales bacterium]
MKENRMIDMEKYINEKSSATMEELCAHFNVSMNTVRRDVAQLLKRGTVEKVYGGVCARRNDSALTPYEIRRIDNEEAKVAIGRRAAELVRDGDIIFIDSGTTTLRMIDYLRDRQELNVITNNLEAIIHALPYPNINIIALPGQLRRKTNSFTGDDAVRSLKRYNIRLAFMAATGASMNGVTNSSPMEYEIKNVAMQSCERSILLVGSNKFGVTGLMSYAKLGDFDTVVTDQEPPEEYVQLLQRENTELLIAKN